MIELVANMGNDNAIVNAARVSFGGEDWFELPEDYTVEQRDKLIKYLAEHKHMTPFRHNAQTLRCKMPIFIARQLGKHQAGLSWNEKSRRYVKDKFEYYVPEHVHSIPEGSIKQGCSGIHDNSGQHTRNISHVVKLLQTIYDDMITDGVAPEEARMVLPQNMMVDWVWTGNLLAFAHIYNERSASGAQLLAQEFAAELDVILRKVYPVSWAALTQK